MLPDYDSYKLQSPPYLEGPDEDDDDSDFDSDLEPDTGGEA